MSSLIQLRAAYIEQHEVGAAPDRIVHVPAVGLEGKPRFEMRQRRAAGGGGDLGDARRVTPAEATSGRDARLRPPVQLRIRLRGGGLRAAASGTECPLVRLCGRGRPRPDPCEPPAASGSTCGAHRGSSKARTPLSFRVGAMPMSCRARNCSPDCVGPMRAGRVCVRSAPGSSCSRSPGSSTGAATTHWKYVERLKRCYPRVEVLANALYIDEGVL